MIKKVRTKQKRKGQSTVEYIVLVAAVIAVVFLFLKPGGLFQNTLNGSLKASANTMNTISNRLWSSQK